MTGRVSRTAAGRWIAVAAALWLSAALTYYLPRPGYAAARLAYFLLLAAVAWAGAAGVLRGRPVVAGLAGLGLFLLGFWQAVLWIAVLPAAVALLGASAVARVERRSPRDRPAP